MIEVRLTDAFTRWLDALRDRGARARIVGRIERMENGNPGEVESVGDGVIEMKLHFGPGYRIYFLRHGLSIVILLGGGTKKTQNKDIEAAKFLAARPDLW